MTGLEIENWIENRKFRSTGPRTELNFRFGLTSCRSQNLPTEVRSLLCQVFDSFFSRNLVKLTPCLTPPRIYPKSNKAKLKLPFNWADDELFTSAGDFRQVHGHHQWMNGQEVLAIGSPVIEDLVEGVPRTCTVWQRTLLWDTRTTIFYSWHQSRHVHIRPALKSALKIALQTFSLSRIQRHYYRVGSHLKFQTVQNETFQSVPEVRWQWYIWKQFWRQTNLQYDQGRFFRRL